jgi:integrase
LAEDPLVRPVVQVHPQPWNKGSLVGQKKPLQPKHVWSTRVRLEITRRWRDLALFNLAIDSKLRACDLVRLRIDEVCSRANIRHRATVVQKKTGRPVQFEITEQTKASLEAWLRMLRTTGSRYLFPSRLHARPHLSTRQYSRLVHRWVDSIGLDSISYGTHSMRRTKATQIYRKTGDLRAVHLLLGHTKTGEHDPLSRNRGRRCSTYRRANRTLVHRTRLLRWVACAPSAAIHL